MGGSQEQLLRINPTGPYCTHADFHVDEGRTRRTANSKQETGNNEEESSDEREAIATTTTTYSFLPLHQPLLPLEQHYNNTKSATPRHVPSWISLATGVSPAAATSHDRMAGDC